MWPYSDAQTLDLVREIARIELEGGEPEFLAKGSNNEAFRVGQAVVRVTGDWRELSVRREAWCYARAEELGIPVPRVRGRGKLEKLPYLILDFVEGRTGTDAGGLDLWRRLGRDAALVNSLDVSEGVPDLFDSPAEAWRRDVDACLTHRKAEGLSRRTDEALRAVRDRPMRFGLSHGDLDPRNLIVTPDGEIVLIDWCCARCGPVPHVDLYNILRETPPDSPEMDAYLEGYGMARAAFEAVLPEVRTFGLMEALKDVRWARAERPDLLPERLQTLRWRTAELAL